MTRLETQELINLVTLYRPSYTNNFDDRQRTSLIDEWFSKLNEYDFNDIKDNLNNFFRDESYRIPTPFDLIRGIRTISQKNNKGETYIYCDVCRKPLEVFINKETNKMNRTEANAHIDRCHSIRYLGQLYRRYFNREIPASDIQNMKHMSKYEFDEVYYKILEKAYERMSVGETKQLLKRVLETRGQE